MKSYRVTATFPELPAFAFLTASVINVNLTEEQISHVEVPTNPGMTIYSYWDVGRLADSMCPRKCPQMVRATSMAALTY
jgi:hypothetical protein